MTEFILTSILVFGLIYKFFGISDEVAFFATRMVVAFYMLMKLAYRWVSKERQNND